jgi:hypothetical protein
MRATWPAHLIAFDFITLIIFWEDCTLWSFSLRSLSQPPTTSSLLGPNILLSTLFSDILNLCSSLRMRDPANGKVYIPGMFTIIKWSLFLTEHYAIKAYWGSGGIAPRILDFGTRWRWVASFTPRPLYSQGKSPWYPLDRRLGGPQNRSERGGKEKIFQPLLGDNKVVIIIIRHNPHHH